MPLNWLIIKSSYCTFIYHITSLGVYMLHHDYFDLPGTTQLSQDEGQSPHLLLVLSYGLAAISAVIAAFAGIGLWPSVLIFWLGGAVTAFAAGVIKAGRSPSRTDQQFSPELD